ncbi:MAG: caspase family protein [Candidatus Melainabacteria bacterium]|nr:caspase family protein [Candidatus Melainabacteria bacterium]
MVNSIEVVSRYARVLDRVAVCVLVSVASFLVCSSSVSAQSANTAPVNSENAKTEIAPIADKWAVVVGVSKYSDKRISLPNAAKDAQTFATFLTTKGNFAADHVKVLLDADATRDSILTTIGRDWLPRVAGADDLIVVYIRAAGSPAHLDVGGINYVLPADAERDRLYSTGIALQDLPRILRERTHARQLVAIADADYSAGLLKETPSIFRRGKTAPHKDILIVAACGNEQRSRDDKTAGGSIFTKCLIEALQSNGAETKFSSVFQQLAKNVQSDVQKSGAKQTPEIKATGEIVLLAKPAAPRAVPQLESRSE